MSTTSKRYIHVYIYIHSTHQIWNLQSVRPIKKRPSFRGPSANRIPEGCTMNDAANDAESMLDNRITCVAKNKRIWQVPKVPVVWRGNFATEWPVCKQRCVLLDFLCILTGWRLWCIHIFQINHTSAANWNKMIWGWFPVSEPSFQRGRGEVV